ncbi:MAG: histone deacetylase [Candidatus Altiarchaeota archaeon]
MIHETGIVFHEDCRLHRQGLGHPERPQRISACVEHLKETGVWGGVEVVAPSPASEEDVLKVHSREHVDRVRRASDAGGGFLDSDTYACPDTYRVALLASGGLNCAADAIIDKRVSNAFALIRPPGHHAERDKAMGFCYFNNPAVCARHLQNTHGLGRILILDWDAHAGNGTTSIFYGDASVMVVSIHQDPLTLYPGTGFADEEGEGDGLGYTVNIPMPPGSGDAEYALVFDELVVERVDDFKPDFIIASAGFDSHRDDPLSSLNVTEEGYDYMTGRLMEFAERHCKGRLLIELEGGYNLDSLSSSVNSVIETLTGAKTPQIKGCEADRRVKELVRKKI